MLSASSLAYSVSCQSLRVDWVPCLALAMWPCAVAEDGGRCFCINSTVSPGQDFSWLFFIAFNNVDFVGEHSV